MNMLIPLDAIVRIHQLTCPDYSNRVYNRLCHILICDYRWFDSDGCSVTDGLTYLWASNNDLEIVLLEFCR